jgi:hypothetical protein
MYFIHKKDILLTQKDPNWQVWAKPCQGNRRSHFPMLCRCRTVCTLFEKKTGPTPPPPPSNIIYNIGRLYAEMSI